MKKTVALALASLLALAGVTVSVANVVRPAPDFPLASGKSLKTLRGQPVVLIVAPSPRSRAFRKQVRRLEEEYEKFAARSTVFVAVFTQNSDNLRSSIPFAVARDGAAVAASYGAAAPFTLMVVGRDGNLDLKTTKVSPASRVRDAILNNYTLQAAERRM